MVLINGAQPGSVRPEHAQDVRRSQHRHKADPDHHDYSDQLASRAAAADQRPKASRSTCRADHRLWAPAAVLGAKGGGVNERPWWCMEPATGLGEHT